MAAVFQEELCLAILRGLRAQLIADGRMMNNEIGVLSASDAVERPEDAIKQHVCDFIHAGRCRQDSRGERQNQVDARVAAERQRLMQDVVELQTQLDKEQHKEKLDKFIHWNQLDRKCVPFSDAVNEVLLPFPLIAVTMTLP